MWPSSPTIQAGQISVYCADARRRRSGRNASVPRWCARILTRISRSPPRASLRWLALCCWMANGPKRRNSFAKSWRYDNFSGDLEAQILDVFKNLITDVDHKTRMDMRLYAADVDGAMRSASRAGGNAPAIAKARVAVIKKAADAKAQLDGVPAEARGDIGYIFSRVQWLRREEKATEAAERHCHVIGLVGGDLRP